MRKGTKRGKTRRSKLKYLISRFGNLLYSKEVESVLDALLNQLRYPFKSKVNKLTGSKKRKSRINRKIVAALSIISVTALILHLIPHMAAGNGSVAMLIKAASKFQLVTV